MNKLVLFHQFIEDKTSANFRFSPPDVINNSEGRIKMYVTQCIFPQPLIEFPESFIILEEGEINIPAFFASDIFDVVNHLNNSLPYEIFNVVSRGQTLFLHTEIYPGESITFSPNLAELLTEGRPNIVVPSFSNTYVSHLSSDLKQSAFYLTSNLMKDSLTVEQSSLPVLATLLIDSTNVYTTHFRLLWQAEKPGFSSLIKKGIHRNIDLSICDREGHIVKLQRGLVFLQLKLCYS